MTIDAHIARVVDAAPPLSDEQVDRLAAILNARSADATNVGTLDRAPDRAPTTDFSGDPGPEVGRAA